jgi:exocyst complex component 5
VSVRRAEAQHDGNVKELGRALENTIGGFRKLDGTLNGVEGGQEGGVNVALRIGERLEELERQRQRAADAKRLLRCWIEVSERGSLEMLESLKRRPGGEGKVRSAALARQLLKISQRLEASDGQVNGVSKVNGARKGPEKRGNGRELIEKFLEGLETDLLQQFDVHYRRQNFDGMKVRILCISAAMLLIVNRNVQRLCATSTRVRV